MNEHNVNALRDAVINDGDTYKARIAAVREDRPRDMLDIAQKQAHAERAQFGTAYTQSEIYQAAAQALTYMHDHVEELDRCDKEDRILNGRDPVSRDGRYVIVSGSTPGLHNFRVVNLETGSESSLYSMAECERIIALALKGELKGSFDL